MSSLKKDPKKSSISTTYCYKTLKEIDEGNPGVIESIIIDRYQDKLLFTPFSFKSGQGILFRQLQCMSGKGNVL